MIYKSIFTYFERILHNKRNAISLKSITFFAITLAFLCVNSLDANSSINKNKLFSVNENDEELFLESSVNNYLFDSFVNSLTFVSNESYMPPCGGGPCDATRWTSGGAWNIDSSIDDDTPAGDGTADMVDGVVGIVKCASTASTQSNIQSNSCYDSNVFNIDVSGLTCTDPSSGLPVSILNPTEEEPVIWLNFDVRANAGTFQVQINDNSGDNIGWALYSSDVITDGVSLSPPHLSGDCTGLTLEACGQESSATWNTLPVSNFATTTNYYMAIWDQDADGSLSVNNFKARFGCGDSEMCNLSLTDISTQCNDTTYKVTVNVAGVNGTYILIDSTGLGSNITPSSLVLTNMTSQPAVISGTFCITYPIGVDYDFIINETSGAPDDPNVPCLIDETGAAPNCPVCTATCEITGPDDPFCPGSSQDFEVNITGGCTSPTYSWTITGNGSISGANNESTVTVISGELCGEDYTLTSSVTCAGCNAIVCDKVVLVEDTIAPVLVPTATPIVQHQCTPYDVTTLSSYAAGTLSPADSATYTDYLIQLYISELSPIIEFDECGTSTSVFDHFDIEYPAETGGTLTVADCPVRARYILHYYSTDGCNDTEMHTVTVEIVDTTAPILEPTATPIVQHQCTPYDVTTLSSYAAGTLSPADSTTFANYVLGLYLTDLAPISNTDNCGDATIVFDHLDIEYTEMLGGTILLADCPVIARFTLHYYSTDGCNDTEMYTVTIEGIDSIAPTVVESDTTTVQHECTSYDVLTLFAYSQGALSDTDSAAFAQYVLDLYLDVLAPTVTDDCMNAEIVFTDLDIEYPESPFLAGGTLTGTDCPVRAIFTLHYYATDGCNSTADYTVTIEGVDNTDPVITMFPGNENIDCSELTDLTEEALEAYFIANFMGTTVTYEDICIPYELLSLEQLMELGFVSFNVGVNTPDNCIVSAEITMTVSDGCNDVSESMLLIITDNVAPTVVESDVTTVQHECTTSDVLTLASYALGTLSPADSTVFADYVLDLYLDTLSPSISDNCGNASIVFDHLEIEYPENPVLPGGTLTEADCPLRARFTLYYYATDGCNNSEMYSVTIEAVDTIFPEITLFPDDITIECSLLEDQSEEGILAYLLAAYDASDVSYTDNCVPFDSLSIFEELGMELISGEIISDFSDPCNAWCAKILTVTDGCNSVSDTFTVSIVDTEGPIFETFVDSIDVQCLDEVPPILDLTAEDCGPVDVTSWQSETGALISHCELTDAIGGQETWSLWLPVLADSGLVSSGNFIWDSLGGTFDCFDDNTAHLYGTVINDINSNEKFVLDFWFENKADWATWDSLGRLYKDDVDCAEPTGLFEDWDYWELVGGMSHAIGQGDLVGSSLSFYHSPSNFILGFQLGEGANNKNCNFGLSGWFTYTGIVDGMQVVGSGDINVDADCEEIILSDCVHNTEFKYIYRAIDECWNTTWDCQIITVNDTTPPMFTLFPADTTILCNEWSLDTAMVAADDNCSGDVTISAMFQDSIGGNCPNSFEIHRTWRATDICLNFVDRTQIITVVDTIAPVLSGLPDMTYMEVQCDSIPGFVVTATDNCPGNVEIATTVSSTLDVYGPCDYMITRTWVATDVCGNMSDVFTLEIHVIDTNPPVFGPYDMQVDVECDELMDFTITALDACNGAVVTYEETLNSGGCSWGVYTRIYTATDSCGNSSTATQYITIIDTIAPELIGVPASDTLECDQVVIPTSGWIFGLGGVTAIDNCMGELDVAYDETIEDGPCDDSYFIIRTWSAIDSCGNAADSSQTRTVLDTTPPSWTSFPDDLDFDCSDIIPTIATPEATDNCDADVDVSIEVDTLLGNCVGNFVIRRIFTAVDNCENMTSDTLTITVTDTTAPDFSYVPMDYTYECTDTIPDSMATADDDCSGPAMVSFIDYTQMTPWRITGNTGTVDLSGVPTDITLVTGNDSIAGRKMAFTTVKAITISFDWDFLSTDTAGAYFDKFKYRINGVNTLVTVNSGPDHQTGHLDIVLNAGDSFALLARTVDGIEGSATIEVTGISVVSTPLACPIIDCFIREFTAEDECGNTSYATQFITIEDTTPPVFDPYDLIIDMSCDMIDTTITVTATDACPLPTITYFDDVYQSGGCEESIVRTYFAEDSCGNISSVEQIIHLYDSIAPSFIDFPIDTMYQCIDDVPAPAMVIGEDNCDEDTTIEYLGADTVETCPMYITRTWTIEDNCQNITTRSQLITVNDTIDPTFDDNSFPGDQNLDCGDETPYTEPVAMDNCTAMPNLSYNDVTVGIGCVVVKTRTWTATDDCGNITARDQVFTFTDNDAPVFTYIPESEDLDCNTEVITTEATAEDACNNGAIISYSDDIIGDNQNCYVLTRIWTVIDSCGNSFTSPTTTVYTITDDEAPVFDQEVEDVAVQCASDAPDVAVITATDNCQDVVEVMIDVLLISSDSCGNSETLITYSAMDSCGNIADSISYTITVQDTIAPVIDGDPQDIEITCDDEVPNPLDVFTAIDNCDTSIEVVCSADTIGHAPTPGSISDCALSTGPSHTDPAWSLEFSDGWPTNDVHYITTAAYFVELPGDIAHLYGHVESITTGGGWDIDIWFDNGMNWADWSTGGGLYKDDYNEVGLNYVDWTYYIMTSGSATLTGTGIYASSSLALTHAPANYLYGYQVGIGANNVNTNFGNGGWFNFSGMLVTDGGTAESISGAGDLAFDADCCLEYEIERTYTATDCSGNSSSVSYRIIVGEAAMAIPGCTAGDACNYNPDATEDDGSCEMGGWYIPVNQGAGPAIQSCTASAGYMYANQGCVALVIELYPYCIETAWDIVCQEEYDVCFDIADEFVFTYLPADVTIDCADDYMDIPTAETTCNLSTEYEIIINDFETSFDACILIIERTFTLVDACGNELSYTQTISVIDMIAPYFDGESAESTFECNEFPLIVPPLAIDNCDENVEISSEISIIPGGCEGERTEILTFIATDNCGNVSQPWVFTAHYVDTTPPVFLDEPADVYLECGDELPFSDLEAYDNCSEVYVEFSEEFDIESECAMTIYWTWVAVDGCGNMSTFTQIITIVDDTAPVFLMLDLTAYLGGPLNPETFEMNDYIRTDESFPLVEPYTQLGYEHVNGGGNEVVSIDVLAIDGSDAIVDWVFVELRAGNEPTLVLETQAALIQKDGDIVSAEDGVSNLTFNHPCGSVLVVIRHRNHIGVCNLDPTILSETDETIILDFTDPSLAVMGGELAMGIEGDKRVLFAGDANHDGSVNPFDKNNHWRVENGSEYEYFYSKSDFNLDGAINPFDKNAKWRVNNGRSEQID